MNPALILGVIADPKKLASVYTSIKAINKGLESTAALITNIASSQPAISNIMGQAASALAKANEESSSGEDEALKKEKEATDAFKESLGKLKTAATDLYTTVSGAIHSAGKRLFTMVNSAAQSVKDVSAHAEKYGVSLQHIQQAMYASARSGKDLETTLKLIEECDPGMKKLAQEAQEVGAVFSDDAVKNLEHFNSSLGRIQGSIAGFKNTLITGITPSVLVLLERLNSWLDANRDLINSKIEEWAAAISDAIIVLSNQFEHLDAFVQKIGGWETVFDGIAVALAGLGFLVVAAKVSTLWTALKGVIAAFKLVGLVAAIALAKPLLIGALITALIVGLALAIEDVIVFLRGGDSMLGRFLNKFGPLVQQMWSGLVQGTKDAANNLILQFSAFVDRVKSYIEDLFNSIRSGFNNLVATGQEFVTKIINAFANFFSQIAMIFNLLFEDWNVLWMALEMVLADVLEGLKGHWDGFVDHLRSALNNAAEIFREAFEGPINWLTETIQGLLGTFEAAKNAVSNPGKAVLDMGRGVLARVGDVFAPDENNNPRSPTGGLQTQNASTQVNVHVDGSNANPADIGSEVARGAEQGMGRALRQTQAAIAGGEQ